MDNESELKQQEELQKQIDFILSAVSQLHYSLFDAIMYYIEDLEKLISSVQSMWEQMKNIFKTLDVRKNERDGWIRKRKESLKSLLIDKRPTIFHCRNAC